jgi:uncharacterized protein YggE
MLKKSLAALVLSASLATLGVGCGDRAPHIIQVPVQKAEAERPGQMTVTGQATLELSPDCADVSITINVEHDKTSAGVRQLEQKKLALIASLKAAGIDVGHVKLSSLVLEPVYAVDARGYPTTFVRTYRAQLTLTATTRDFAKISDIMDAGASAGATAMSAQYRRSDLPEQKTKVRDMALAAAKAKAEQTASALGIHLGRVVSVVENAGGYMWGNQYFPSNVSGSMQDQANLAASAALGGALQPLTLDVTIGYELADKT